MGTDLDYLTHLARESARFADVLRNVPPDAPVTSCPEWNADDLLWHLAEVQWFWGTIVREKMTGRQAQEVAPDRPAGREGLAAFYSRASHDLGKVLAATAPSTPAWTWSQDQTVGFIRRRQAHEALIHRIDAELAADDRTPADARLSADGVDEVLRVMYGYLPPWGTFTPDVAKTLRLRATDTGDSWFITLGQFTGIDPDDGTSHDEPGMHTAETDPGTAAAGAVSGAAADLDCWLWRRPPMGPIERSGSEEVIDAFESTIAEGID